MLSSLPLSLSLSLSLSTLEPPESLSIRYEVIVHQTSQEFAEIRFTAHEQTDLTANQNSSEEFTSQKKQRIRIHINYAAAPACAHTNIFKLLYKLLNLIEILSLN